MCENVCLEPTREEQLEKEVEFLRVNNDYLQRQLTKSQSVITCIRVLAEQEERKNPSLGPDKYFCQESTSYDQAMMKGKVEDTRDAKHKGY